jgi:protein ImuB
LPLDSLPVAALRLPTRILQTLHELDIRQVKQLQALPRETLASRFGAEVARRLDQATGEIEELITPVRLPEPVEATCSFEEPVANRHALQMVVRQLLDKITHQLESTQQGVRSLLVHLRTTPGRSGKAQGMSFTVGLVQPRASARHLLELIEMKFERLTLTSPVTDVLLRATTTTHLLKQQHHILGDQQTQQRSGVRPKRYPDAQPEYAFRLKAVVKSQGTRVKSRKGSSRPSPALDSCPLSLAPSARPLQLEPTPLPIRVISVIPNGPPVHFYWRDQDHRIARYWGPERIEAGWWRERNTQRDYYRVETECGQQFWVFQCLSTREWFLQGAFE